ncbi:NTP transferase domain-containing protein [Melioribacteraceae bacterium 4301-Me]|uniref:phosphocholine cytidylyltransferase family protein n=1 Tax=Pyranulibacter aquaticus TaxID=3163344 RepID=UPI00359B5EF9
MKIKNAVICAAGIGSRLGLDMPKCLVKIGNHKLIYYLLKVLEDVPNIRIVVGFKEEEVIEYVRSIRNDVIFVRNPDYRTTTNSYSLYLGSYDLSEPFINIDGDMYIDKKNYNLFLNQIIQGENLIGITKAYTEEPVFVQLNKEGKVIKFSREKISEYEWTGIAYFNKIRISKEGHYVYQELEKFLPIQACEIECYEIDTPQDLDYVSNKIDLHENQ